MSVAKRLTTLVMIWASSAELLNFSGLILTVYLLELMGVIAGLTVILKSNLEKNFGGHIDTDIPHPVTERRVDYFNLFENCHLPKLFGRKAEIEEGSVTGKGDFGKRSHPQPVSKSAHGS